MIHPSRTSALVEHVLQDVRGAFRRFRRERGFAATVIITVALAVGLATTVYTIANGVLLRALPYSRPGELVQVWETTPEWDRLGVSIPDYEDWRKQCRAFAALGALRETGFHVMTSHGAEWASAAAVTTSLFPLLGVNPLIGRRFAEHEDLPGKNKLVMLDEGFWHRAFGGDPGVIGTKIRLVTRDQRFIGPDVFEIIGVMPSHVRLLNGYATWCDLWVPLTPHPLEQQENARGAPALKSVFARLRPGVSISQAQADAQTVFSRHNQADIRENPGMSISVSGLSDAFLGHARPALLVLGVAVLVVLLIAGANLVNLLLVSGLRRRDELSTRLALGCSRARLVQQLVTEHLLLATCGGALGGLLAFWAIPLAARLAPATLPRLDQVRFDGASAAFALGLSAIGGLLFGLLPALVASRPGSPGRSSTRATTPARFRLTSAPVVGEMAMVVVLLAAAGLVANSLWRLSRVELGFDPGHVLTLELALPPEYDKPGRIRTFESALLEKLRARPGVVGASTTTALPFGEWGLSGYRLAGDDRDHHALISAATTDFLRELRVPLLAGRMLTPADEDNPRVAVVNERLARQAFPGRSAIGQRVGYMNWYEIVGVVGDITEIAALRNGLFRRKGLDRTTVPQIYLPSSAAFSLRKYLVVRTDGRGNDPARGVVADLRSVAPEVAVRETSTLDARVTAAGDDTRFYVLLLGSFAGVGFVLAGVGLFGVLGYSVARRTREFGVRLALGATPNRVRHMVVAQAFVLVCAGAVIGLSLALAGTRTIQSFLFETSPSDPRTLVTAIVVLIVGGLAAAYVPARRASRTDPMAALRCE